MPPALGDPGSRAATTPATPEEPGRPAVVTPLRRPPVRQSVLVRAPQRRTFDTFVRTIGAWWPVQPFSAGKDRVRAVTVERRRGGRVYETWADGTEVTWGELLAWQPPERLVMTWTMTPAATEVELMFAARVANLLLAVPFPDLGGAGPRTGEFSAPARLHGP